MEQYIQGLIAGFALSFLMGPLFFMLLRIGIEHGFRPTMIYCSGVWVSDFFYILATYFGISYVTALTEIDGFKIYLGVFGGGLLVAFGIASMIVKPAPIGAENLILTKISPFALFAKGFAINTFNPFTVFFWLILSSKLSIEKSLTYTDAGLFYGGLYTMLISTDALKALLAKKIQQRITPALLAKVRIGLGIALIVFGIILAIRVLWIY
jgi:threonine/homoserine/homoserine lactone efflux protein